MNFQVREEDINRDGYKDTLYFELESLISENENIYGLTFMLLFDYRLYVSFYKYIFLIYFNYNFS